MGWPLCVRWTCLLLLALHSFQILTAQFELLSVFFGIALFLATSRSLSLTRVAKRDDDGSGWLVVIGWSARKEKSSLGSEFRSERNWSQSKWVSRASSSSSMEKNWVRLKLLGELVVAMRIL